jgi:signal transduction histidine kinase
MVVLQDHTQIRESEQSQCKAEKAASLGLMAAGLSHDFNYVFQSLLTSLELVHSQSDHSGRHFLDRAMTSLERASNMSRRLMEFSGGSFTHLDRLSLNSLIQEWVGTFQKGRPHLRLLLAPDLVEIKADRDQIRRVLSILIENADEAMGSGGGTVTVTTEQIPEVTLAERRRGLWMLEAPKGPWVRLSVSDSAGGVTRDQLDHLFDPFFSTRALGRGLGLPAALGLIRGHQAGLQVINDPGKGMTFRIYLPIERSA